ncbi:hypothetical protein RSSM_04273 [Rhodopirellula sallentina SM41]|uniref:Uncharacterized protein n=1 Tax=Rhodopirellula sallentina SM41 TaxID=1263870 RepID=M5TYJ5_9BACT|nr:hypothetical protein RSSM_04273 [Rhodopirellula sallentina SM41]
MYHSRTEESVRLQRDPAYMFAAGKIQHCSILSTDDSHDTWHEKKLTGKTS